MGVLQVPTPLERAMSGELDKCDSTDQQTDCQYEVRNVLGVSCLQ